MCEPLTSTPVKEGQLPMLTSFGPVSETSPMAPMFSLVDESSSIEQSEQTAPSPSNDCSNSTKGSESWQ